MTVVREETDKKFQGRDVGDITTFFQVHKEKSHLLK